jgi:hypothetical protein
MTEPSDRDRVAQLVRLLRAAGPDLEPAASELARHTNPPLPALEEARRILTARLHRDLADFTATTALRAVTAMAADIRSGIAPTERDQLQRAGMSNVDRTRSWLRRGRSSHRHHAEPRSSDEDTSTAKPDPRPARALVAHQS